MVATVSAVATLGIALAGGSVGSLTTIFLGVPVQVRENDRLVAEYDEDLESWVADEHVRLERALQAVTEAMNATGQLYSGAHLRGRAIKKEEALHRYRDQERKAVRRRHALRNHERGPHRTWRFLSGRGPVPELTSPDRAQPVIDNWRAPVTQGSDKATVSDPTRRSLAQTIADLNLAD